ncbi:MAG TPA: HAD domain-containing protein [Solirubrobacteraceae bacterium]|nr:HAD domain-containing protein [Solirubrobacteraceae bacterium]
MEPKVPLGDRKEPAPSGIVNPADGAAEHPASSAGASGERPARGERPLLMVDVDGVISLFSDGWGAGGTGASQPGSFHSIEGMPHFLSATAATHLLALAEDFELVWASGWEERADEHLPHLLGLPQRLPFLRFERAVGRANAHWKLDAIEAFAGARPLAWIDDALGSACEEWALARAASTLLVQTDPRQGLTAVEAKRLSDWARALPGD